MTSTPPAPEAGPSAAFFAHDLAESTVRKRATAFQDNGVQVTVWGFRRGPVGAPAWAYVELGETRDRRYLRRTLQLVVAALRVIAGRRRLAETDFWYARNLDMALIALFARAVCGSAAPFVYEVLDVHRLMTGRGAASRLARFVERRVLRRTDLLVVSSPAFSERYFRPRQGYQGRVFLLENKVRAAPTRPPRPRRPQVPTDRWAIGWFGALRDTASLELLTRIADRLGDRVVVHVRGREAGVSPAALAEARRRPNIRFGGGYRNPEDLAEVYGQVHFTWAIDLFYEGLNSDWLLSNRLYEGGLYGALALGAEGTQVARKIADLDLGWSFRAPFDESVVAFLERLDPAAWAAKAQGVLALPEEAFVDLTDTGALIATVRALETAGEIRFGETARVA